jgi:hypothetical protein
MALSANASRNYEPDSLHESAQPAQAVVTYAGSALTRDSGGEVGPLNTSETFVGFAIAKVDNSGGSAGDLNVPVYDRGVVELTVTGLDDNNDLGDAVYATDDGTFTLTASGALQIGKVIQVKDLTNNICRVQFEGDVARSI